MVMTDQDTYRLVVFLPGTRRVLAIDDGSGPHLPTVAIPRFSRVAQQITQFIERRWNLQSIVLDHFGETSNPGIVLEARGCNPALRGNGSFTIDADALADLDLTRSEQASLGAILSGEPDGHKPFARLGWMDGLTAWIEEQVSRHRWKLTGQFRQLNASPSFSLIRFETTGPALWFKAVGEPNLREFSISATLAKLFPAYVPPLVATHSSWNGWLTVEVEGSHADGGSEIELWKRAVRSFARLQLESTQSVPQLIEAGCRDLRIPALLELVEPFIDFANGLMKTQSKTPPPVLSTQELQVLGRDINGACLRLAQLRLPDGLGHLDFNPGNILVSSRACAFLDWAEACVSSPFLTLQYLLEHYRRSNPDDSAKLSHLVSAYTEVWESVAATEQICEALELAPLIAVFAYAVGNDAWRDAKRLEDARLAGYFRALIRRMQRVATAIERRELCPA